jgi:hypothetical protein
MSGFRGSLEEQAAQLSKSIHNRERKRNDSKMQRQVAARQRHSASPTILPVQHLASHLTSVLQLNAEDKDEADVGGSQAKRQALMQDSGALAAARAASAAAAAAAQLRTHDVMRCDLCQVGAPGQGAPAPPHPS